MPQFLYHTLSLAAKYVRTIHDVYSNEYTLANRDNKLIKLCALNFETYLKFTWFGHLLEMIYRNRYGMLQGSQWRSGSASALYPSSPGSNPRS